MSAFRNHASCTAEQYRYGLKYIVKTGENADECEHAALSDIIPSVITAGEEVNR
jgi:hypothetical protein